MYSSSTAFLTSWNNRSKCFVKADSSPFDATGEADGEMSSSFVVVDCCFCFFRCGRDCAVAGSSSLGEESALRFVVLWVAVVVVL